MFFVLYGEKNKKGFYRYYLIVDKNNNKDLSDDEKIEISEGTRFYLPVRYSTGVEREVPFKVSEISDASIELEAYLALVGKVKFGQDVFNVLFSTCADDVTFDVSGNFPYSYLYVDKDNNGFVYEEEEYVSMGGVVYFDGLMLEPKCSIDGSFIEMPIYKGPISYLKTVANCLDGMKQEVSRMSIKGILKGKPVEFWLFFQDGSNLRTLPVGQFYIRYGSIYIMNPSKPDEQTRVSFETDTIEFKEAETTTLTIGERLQVEIRIED